MENYIKNILMALAESQLRFIVAGGVACVFQGVERMTLDLDLSVDMNQENMEKFLEVMLRLNLKPRVPVPSEVLLDTKLVKQMAEEKNALVFTFINDHNPLMQVDIFLTPTHSYSELIAYCEQIPIGKHRLCILTKEKLLDLKRKISPLRPKDEMDIKILEKLIQKQK